jgi:hypothetical protein
MPDQTYSFQDPRAQRLVEGFESLGRDLDITAGARRLMETYFYANYGKFAARGGLDRLFNHLQLSFPVFTEAVRSRAVNGRIDAQQMRDALTDTARIYYSTRLVSEDDVRADEKIPPPKW